MTRYRIVEGELGAVEVDGQELGHGRVRITDVRREDEPVVPAGSNPHFPRLWRVFVHLTMRIETSPGDHLEIYRHYAPPGREVAVEQIGVPRQPAPIRRFLHERFEEDLLRDWHLAACQMLRPSPAALTALRGSPLFSGSMSCDCELQPWMLRQWQTRNKLLGLHHEYTADSQPWELGYCAQCTCPRARARSECSELVRYPCDTLKVLAAPYDWHPAFDLAWRLP